MADSVSIKIEQQDNCCKNCIHYIYNDSEKEYWCANDDIMASLVYVGLYAYFSPDENFYCSNFERKVK